MLRNVKLHVDQYDKTFQIFIRDEETKLETLYNYLEFFRVEASRYNQLIIDGTIQSKEIQEIEQITHDLLSALPMALASEQSTNFIKYSIAQLLDIYIFLCLKLHLLGKSSANLQNFKHLLEPMIEQLKLSKDIPLLYHCECAYETLKQLEEKSIDLQELAEFILRPKQTDEFDEKQGSIAKNIFIYKCAENIDISSKLWFKSILLLKEIIYFNPNWLNEKNLFLLLVPFNRRSTNQSWKKTNWRLWHTFTLLISQILRQIQIDTNDNASNIRNELEAWLFYLAGFEEGKWQLRSDERKHFLAALELEGHLTRNNQDTSKLIELRKQLSILGKWSSVDLENPEKMRLKHFALRYKTANNKSDESSKYELTIENFVNLFFAEPEKKKNILSLFKRSRNGTVVVDKNISSEIFAEYCLREWAAGKLWTENFEYVFFISTQKLAQCNYQNDETNELVEIVFNQLFSSLQNHTEIWVRDFANSFIFQHYLAEKIKQLRALFIIDWKESCVKTMSPGLQAALEQFLTAPSVLVTTKFVSSPILRDKLLPDIALPFFSFASVVPAYIDAYFKQLSHGNNPGVIDVFKKRAQLLKPVASEYPGIHHSQQHPLYIKMFCDFHELNDVIPKTMTSLHFNMVLFCFRQLSRKESTMSRTDFILVNEFQREILFLEYLAFTLFKSPDIWLYESLIEFFPESDDDALARILDQLANISLLQSNDGYDLLTETNPKTAFLCEFIHPSIQSLFCAFYLLKNPVYKQSFFPQLSQSNKELVLPFMSGIIKNYFAILFHEEYADDPQFQQNEELHRTEALNDFFGDLLTQYKSSIYDRIAIRCWNEAECDSTLIPDHVTLLTYKVNRWMRNTLQSIIDLLQKNPQQKLVAAQELRNFVQEMNQNHFVFNNSQVQMDLSHILSTIDHDAMTSIIDIAYNSGLFSEYLQNVFNERIKEIYKQTKGKEISVTQTAGTMYASNDNNASNVESLKNQEVVFEYREMRNG